MAPSTGARASLLLNFPLVNNLLKNEQARKGPFLLERPPLFVGVRTLEYRDKVRLIRSAMNRLWKSMIIVFLFFVGTAFPLISHADQGDNVAGLVTWNNDRPEKIRTRRERGMAGSLPINGEVRTKGLLVGLWGGEHISMQVTELRTTVEYDCAHATIDRRIALDRQGRFDVSGMQIEEHGGPVRQNEQLPSYPVRFAGQVKGKRMKLSVRNSATKRLVGIFTLVYGSEPKLIKCK